MDSWLLLGIILGGIMGFLLSRIFSMWSQVKDRQSSIRQSKASILGHVKEQLAPISPWFPYHIKDMVFIGKGFDYLVLDGLSEGKLNQIVFLEIKSWSSTQNRNEKQIENVIDAKVVKYEIIRL
jgi:predicted Holliday junction resolvase-like endonuclease